MAFCRNDPIVRSAHSTILSSNAYAINVIEQWTSTTGLCNNESIFISAIGVILSLIMNRQPFLFARGLQSYNYPTRVGKQIRCRQFSLHQEIKYMWCTKYVALDDSEMVEVDKLEKVEGIGPVYAGKLLQAGAKTTKDLLKLAKTPEDRKKLAESTLIDEHMILKWANHADLMRIKGIRGQFAELLEKVGVDTVNELANRNADNLYEAVKKFDLTISPIVRRKPGKASIVAWIKQTKRLKPTLTY